jgi:predicted nucleic acid-binding protein
VSAIARQCALIDTSVLINFLAIDQVKLLLLHPQYRFVLRDHVRYEVTEFYPKEKARLEAILRQEAIEQIRVDATEELEIFAGLIRLKRFGAGECAAIAAAVNRGCSIAIDDKAASSHVRRAFPSVFIETTQSLVVGLIQAGVLSVGLADEFKSRWEREHRFRFKFASFQDVL